MPATPTFWLLTLMALWSERLLQLHVRLYLSHGHVSNYNMKRETATNRQPTSVERELCSCGSRSAVWHGIKMMEMKYLNPLLYFSASHRKHCKNVKSRIGHCSDSSPKVLYQDITSFTIILTAFFTVTENKMKKKNKHLFSLKKKCFTSSELSQLSYFSKHS